LDDVGYLGSETSPIPEVFLDRFSAFRSEDHANFRDAGVDQCLDHSVENRFVPHRQQLFRLGVSEREKS
jgi:hypothetical protein